MGKKNKKELFKHITPDIESKLMDLINTKNPNDWSLTFTLLRAIKGVGRYTAEKWLYIKLHKLYDLNTFDYELLSTINNFLRVNFKMTYGDIVYGTPDIYRNIFNSKHLYNGRPLVGMTQARRKGKTHIMNEVIKHYRWKES